MAESDKAPTPNTNEEWVTTREEYGETIVFDEPGTVFIGKFLGTTVVPLIDKETGELKDTNAHRFADDSGTKFTVWGSYNIDEGIKDIPPGSQTRLEFVNEVKLDGGRSVKEFRVAYKK